MSTYKVVFWGGIRAGCDKASVVRQFAERFKLSDRKQLQHFFSGRIVALRSGISQAKAVKLATTLRELGAECRIEPELNTSWGQAANSSNNYPSGLAMRKREAERRPAYVINNTTNPHKVA